MIFELPVLPYAKDALEPYISRETLEYHYEKHHRAYVNKLNTLIQDTPYESYSSLKDIIVDAQGGIFNNAAQVWNHSFYWHCLSPQGGGDPKGELAKAITQQFGSIDGFFQQFTDAAINLFGSGWVWLIKDDKNQLLITQTQNALTPLVDKTLPLLTCDVWEHAYYIDTRNSRPQYIENFWKLVNWDFVSDNFYLS